MNKWIRGLAVVAGLGAVGLGGGLVAGGTAQAQGLTVGGGGVGVSVSLFYDTLAPYGSWEWMEGYGRVWRPNPYVVGSNFQPYSTGGRWVYTDYGWTWQSDWDWGWAPFHYGRWSADPVLGWVWIPGNEWAPAWVDWRFGGGYAGWCPLGPEGYGATYRPYWSFVETRYLVEPNVYHYAVPVNRIHSVYRATQPVRQTVSYNRSRWSAGPPPAQVGRATGREIRPLTIRPPPPGHVQAVRPVGAPPRSAPPVVSGARPVPGASGFGNRPVPPRSGVGAGVARPPVGGFSAPPSRGGVAQPPSRFGGNTGVVPPSRTAPPSRFGGNTGVVPPSRTAPPTRFGGNTGVVPPSRTAPTPGFGGSTRTPPSRTAPPSRFGESTATPPSRTTPTPGFGGSTRTPPSQSTPPSRFGGSTATPPSRTMPPTRFGGNTGGGDRSPPTRSQPSTPSSPPSSSGFHAPPARSAPSFHPSAPSGGGYRAPSSGGSRMAPPSHRGR